MKTQRQLIEESMAEFDEGFGETDHLETGQTVRRLNGIILVDHALSHQTKLLIDLLDADIQEMEGMMKPEFDEGPCNECGGRGFTVVPEHHPGCDGGCEMCPVQGQAQCPCGDGVIGFPNDKNIGHNSVLTTLIQKKKDLRELLSNN